MNTNDVRVANSAETPGVKCMSVGAVSQTTPGVNVRVTSSLTASGTTYILEAAANTLQTGNNKV